VLGIQCPKVMKSDVPSEWGCGHTLSHFRIRHFDNPKDKELERLDQKSRSRKT
jgi:hypothetical protein